ncbi:hypothetical protein CSC81_06710 [Tenacibaculum discolor]|uniref:DUF4382 domain-containing protein n=1 Tax=Tenacibaculum discolor TaxID=361581 RepID=A0A2G1BVN3_9FLAO|nr:MULTISPECIES: DUF4382 domain-containing protein [Tenacibaculum]MDP2540141.1 DUF4382 domain-containing protein [Tenacibaculum discolor]NVK08246.1 DUF4382 domain-containing protein [Tenacibaculum sp.]PHN98090.1 hypothetical protein CSC81_06710 [Tenacibaculum discolor]PHO00912.1 hypothetical protein CSC82_26345 [Rhodobacteraceae bacterium 4F10]
MKKHVLLLVALATFFTAFISCSSDDTPQMSKVAVRLVDAPGDYDEVNIDVQDVMINSGDEENGWQSLGNVTPQVYNLLELTGGIDALLVDTEIPAGKIGQIRLVLGDNNSIVVNGETFPLATPSAQQSGLKLNVHQDLVGGVKYTFILDFMVDKSIVVEGTGDYSLKPTIRVTTEAASGAISGMVNPFEYQVEVSAVSGTEEPITALTNEEGKFMLHGVPAGTYSVTFTPDEASGLTAKTVEEVTVVLGENTDMGTVELE